MPIDTVTRRPTSDTPARLAGKRCLITGAASGIGLATAQRFLEEGGRVCLTDRDAQTLETATVALIGDWLSVQADVTSADSMRDAVAATVEAFGGLDVVVCNAGVDRAGTVADTDEDQWDLVHNVTLKGMYITVRAAWPHLEASGEGVVLATASICSTYAVPNDAAYCAAKAGVLMLTKCIAIDGATANIRANAICPGFTETPMLTRWLDEQSDPLAARASVAELQPLGRLGHPSDHADAFVYLASSEARWVTGVALTVDGGLTAGMRS